MKNTKIYLLVFLLLAFISQSLALEKTEEIKKSYKLNKSNNYSELQIRNINGSINIETYNGSEIQISVKKTVSADTQTDLEKGFAELNIKVYEHEKGIFIYMDHPCANLNKEELKLNYDCGRNWMKDDDYDFIFDFEVKIPKGVTFVQANTINKGDVRVNNLSCEANINNINGGIEIQNHNGNIYAHTINGDIDIEFKNNPTEFAKFNTINGEINVYCKPELSASIQYKSMSGSFYTNFDISNFLPDKIEINKKTKKSVTEYSLKSLKRFCIGSGKTDFSFNTLNGNMYLRKK